MHYIIYLMLVGTMVEQTDWMGGAGVLCPVDNWGTRYYASDSITAATEGQVSLVATSWDYTSWLKHTVESGGAASVRKFAQGLMPADIDMDGIKDLVAHTKDEVVWYKHNGWYGFSKNVIGPADDGGATAPCVYPCDIDKDNDIDVLVATKKIGVGWYENPSWTYHSLDASIGYHRVSAVDVELDGDIDVIAVDNAESKYYGDIYLFRDTTGSQAFKKEIVKDFSDYEGWRVYSADFNNDGFPDIYSVNYTTYIFLNDGTGHFTESFHADYWAGSGEEFDGAWPSDIDMDGDIDLVCGNQYYSPYGFYALLNDSTGTNFDSMLLVEDASNSYMDGAIARDINLDGFPDIAGTHSKVGWFCQDTLNLLTFTLYPIDDDIPNNSSHWVYAASLCNKCLPSIDLLVTHRGKHIVYENQMLESFASLGWLESSILELSSSSACSLKYFGYEACIPSDTSLAFYWKAGVDSADIAGKPWDGPHSVVTVGIPSVVDSFSVGLNDMRMFQYKAELKGDNDIAVLYKVWLSYDCSSTEIEEKANIKYQNAKLMFSNNKKLILELSREDKVSLEIYNVAGMLTKNVFNGYLPSGVHIFEISEKAGVYFAILHYTGGSRSLKFIKL